jgi:putative tricarboxylic transport membrane protein
MRLSICMQRLGKKYMNKFDYISGLVLLSISVILFFAAKGLPLMDKYGPSSGFFPTILSVILALLSLMIIVRAWWQNRHVKTSQGALKILGPDKKKYFIYLGLFFAFSLFFAQLGYLLSTALFLGFILKYMEKQSWKTTFGIIVISELVSYYLFVKFLSVPLPEGILSSVIPM